jgi:mannose-6-phosphate isomerase-like protein (cupin superfamily)
VKKKATLAGRREFVRGIGAASIAALAAPPATVASLQANPTWGGAIVHANEGQVIPPTPDGRVVRMKVDSEVTPGVRMSMITEDIPAKAEIKVHLHQHEDEIIYIRMGNGIATLGDREVPVTAGAMVYVPQGVWHGLRNNGTDVLGMSAIYSPPGFELAFKDRLVHPNRTPAETEAHRKKFGIVYRDR